MPQKKTDEQRLKDLQAKIEKRQKIAQAKADLKKAQDALRKVRGK